MHLLEKNELSQSTTVGDCCYNIASAFRKLGATVKAIENYEKSLVIRKLSLGPLSLQVSNSLEQLGKLEIERQNYKEAYVHL